MEVKSQLLESHPQLAEDLSNPFKAGEIHNLQQLNTPDNLDPADQAIYGMKGVIGANPIPYRVELHRSLCKPS